MDKKKIAVIVIVSLVVGMMIGFAYGAHQTLQWGVDLLTHFVEFDDEMFLNLIRQGSRDINPCFATGSAFLNYSIERRLKNDG